MAQVTHPTGPNKPLEITPVEPAKKTRKKAPVCIQEIRPSQPNYLADEHGKRREFSSTKEAKDWAKANLETNGMVIDIVAVRDRLTVKAEPQIKVTLE